MEENKYNFYLTLSEHEKCIRAIFEKEGRNYPEELLDTYIQLARDVECGPYGLIYYIDNILSNVYTLEEAVNLLGGSMEDFKNEQEIYRFIERETKTLTLTPFTMNGVTHVYWDTRKED